MCGRLGRDRLAWRASRATAARVSMHSHSHVHGHVYCATAAQACILRYGGDDKKPSSGRLELRKHDGTESVVRRNRRVGTAPPPHQRRAPAAPTPRTRRTSAASPPRHRPTAQRPARISPHLPTSPHLRSWGTPSSWRTRSSLGTGQSRCSTLLPPAAACPTRTAPTKTSACRRPRHSHAHRQLTSTFHSHRRVTTA